MEVVLSGGALQGLCKMLVDQQRPLRTPTTPFFSDAYLHHLGTALKAYRNTRFVLRPSTQMEEKKISFTKDAFSKVHLKDHMILALIIFDLSSNEKV